MSESPERKTVLITGSSSGIGLATAKLLLGRGARVIFHGHEPRQELGPELLELLENSESPYLEANFLKEDAPETLASRLTEVVGSLDGFVHCAATPSHQPWRTVSVSEWERVFSLNLRSAFFLSQALAGQLIASQGSIVFVSSTHAVRVNRNNALYDTSKAALNHLVRSLALELKPEGVRVNAVMPGGVDTPMLEQWLVDYTGSSEAAQQTLADGVKSGSVGQPSDIAEVIAFLLSAHARWITGTSVVADGGALLDR